MNITSKSRYALKIMLDLAQHQNSPLVRRAEIAERQGIPADYLDQIMLRLRAGGLVTSIRGRSGGYRLGRDAQEISLWQIFATVEDAIFPVECVSDHAECAFTESCIAKDIWHEVTFAMRRPLESMTLAAMGQKYNKDMALQPHFPGVQECRHGKSSTLLVSH